VGNVLAGRITSYLFKELLEFSLISFVIWFNKIEIMFLLS